MKFVASFTFFIGIGLFFLYPAFFQNKTALPADILLGHYHPWKDLVWENRESGFPVTNFVISDAITQSFVWKNFTVNELKKGLIPFTNPYNFLGTPHAANIATAVFYPLNIIFLILPILSAWDLFVLIPIVLSGLFMFIFLKPKVSRTAALFGSGIFAVNYFLTNTLELAVIGHTLMWAPLLLYSIDKTSAKPTNFLWVMTISILSVLLLAGFVQISLYLFVTGFIYAIYKSTNFQRKISWMAIFCTAILLTAFQTYPFLKLAEASSRTAGYNSNFSDASQYLMPAYRLINFVIPDYFGNPAKMNFFSTITYGEFANYCSIPVLFFGLWTLTRFKSQKQIRFWWILLFTSLALLIRSPLTEFIYQLQIPFYSALLPSRYLSLTVMSLVILSAYGVDLFLHDTGSNSNRNTLRIIFGFISILFSIALIRAIVNLPSHPVTSEISLRNTILPAIIFIISGGWLLAAKNILAKTGNQKLVVYPLLIISLLDLTRIGQRYNSFSPNNLVLPQTAILSYLKSLPEIPRVIIDHQELIPAEVNRYFNFSLLGGYDSVHTKKREIFINALNFETTDVADKSGRIVFPANSNSKALNILSPKYIMTLDDSKDASNQIMTEGRTRLLANPKAYPRAYLTKNIIWTDKTQILEQTIKSARLAEQAVVTDEIIKLSPDQLNNNEVKITRETPNEMELVLSPDTDGILVLNNGYDAGWKAYDESLNKKLDVYEINYQLTGLPVSRDTRLIELKYQPKEFLIGAIVSLTSLVSLGGWIIRSRYV